MPASISPKPFSLFFREQAPAVDRLLGASLAPEDAEECLQETFIAALRAYDDFDGANPRAWVLTIARRKLIDHARAGARRPEVPLEAEPPASPTPDAPLQAEIWQEVASLPSKQRLAIVLRYRLDLRHREIGAVLACSEAASRRSVHEGLEKLRLARGVGGSTNTTEEESA